MKLGVPMGRLKEMLEGVNIGDEMSFHVEASLMLPSGFLDKHSVELTDDEIARLKSPPGDESPEEQPGSSSQILVIEHPAPVSSTEPANAGPASSAPAELSSTSPQTPQEPDMPRTAKNPPAAPDLSSEEGVMREVRRANFAVLTEPKGAKSRLGVLTGLSPANISHRAHGHKHFDKETGQFFGEKLGLPLDWFEAPRTAADIPDAAMRLLTGDTPITSAPQRTQPRTQSKTTPTKPASAPLAPTKAQKAKAGAKPPKQVPQSAPTPLSTVSTSAPSSAAAVTPQTPAPRPAAPRSTPQLTPIASHPAAVSAELEAGPLVYAYLEVLKAKIREGRLTEDHAHTLLKEIQHL